MRKYIEDRVNKVESGCWEWTKATNASGYGRCRNSGIRYAHRLAYTAFVSDIPEGLCVCHTCDNRKCCNPDHLFLGTHADNMRDMFEKGRLVNNHGRQYSSIRLKVDLATELEIKAARELSGASQRTLAKQFGVSQMTICNVLKRNWNKST